MIVLGLSSNRFFLWVFNNDQFTKFDSPKEIILFLSEEIIFSVNVDPDLGKPIIKIG